MVYCIHQLELEVAFDPRLERLVFLSFYTWHSSSLWTTDTIVFTKLNQPPVSINRPHPLNVFELQKPLGGLDSKLTVICIVSFIFISSFIYFIGSGIPAN